MIEETQQELATDYVLGKLTPAEAVRFEAALASDVELRTFVASLEESAAGLALAISPVASPSGMLGRIHTELRSGQPETRAADPVQKRGAGWIPWALAACFALLFSHKAYDFERMRENLAAIQQKDQMAEMRIAMLSAKVDAYSKAGAVVIWDAVKQRGVVELSQLPPLDTEHDYQLWVIDPAKGHPVSAGVVYVDAQGGARVAFQPELTVQTAQQFALSIERKGGVSSPEGQIVLAGN